MRIEYIFQIIKSKAKSPYHWVCRARNGEIRCCSENYTQKASARQAVKRFVNAMQVGKARWEDLTGETRPGKKRANG